MLKKYLIEEFKQIKRKYLKIIIIMPILILLLIPWAVQDYKNMNVSIIDEDHSVLSEKLIQKVTASGYFRLTATPTSTVNALKTIEAGEADAILEIQPEFESDLMKTGVARVMISVNATNSTKGAQCSQYLQSIVRDYTADLLAENGMTVKPVSPPVDVVTNNQFNPHVNYKMFIVPALMVILLTILIGFLSALNIGKNETEQPDAPVRRLPYMLAKLIAFWVVGCVVLAIVLALAAWVYGLALVGSTATLFLYATLYVLAISGMGIVISNYCSRIEYRQIITAFCILLMVLMCGVFFNIDSMPKCLQAVAKCNPMYYFMEAMRSISLKGSEISNLLPQLFALCGFAVLFSVWAIFSYKKTVNNFNNLNL